MRVKALVLCFLFVISAQKLIAGIYDLKIEPINGNTKITIFSDAPVSYSIFSRTTPPQILVDITNGTIGFSEGTYTVNTAGIQAISVEPFTEVSLVRFVLNTDRYYEYSDTKEGNNVVLTLKNTKAEFAPISLTGKTPELTEKTLPLPTPSPTAPAYGEDVRISLNLVDADIVTVITGIADYVGVNIIFGEDVKGKITIRIENIPWKQALELALRTVDLSYVEEDGVLRIAPPEKIKAEEIKRKKAEEEVKLLQPQLTKVYMLQYAVASEAKNSVQKLLTSKGQIEVDERTNALIVTDIEEVHKQLDFLIKSIDTPVYQVAIEARVLEINRGALDQMGVQWNVQNLRAESVTGEVAGGASSGGMPGVPTVFAKVGILTDYALIDNLISAYEQRKIVRTVSNPKITVLNNTKAQIHGGSKIPFITRDQAGNPITQFLDVGIRLEVTPHINIADQITLDIHTEVSEPGAAMPGGVEVLTNYADTRVLLNNGETAVIGGLIKFKTQKSREGIPFLSRIPLLGRLFGGSTQQEDEREIVIFLTPNIVK